MGTRLRFTIVGLMVILAGCGSQSTGTQPSASPATSSSASAPKPLVVIANPSPGMFASGPTTLRLVSLDGTVMQTLTVKTGAEVQVARGSRIFVTEGGALKALHRDGSVEDLGSLNASSINGPLVASPDGNQWLWGTLEANFHSSVYIAGPGKQPRLIEQATDQTRAVQPYSWTARGPYIEHGAIGIGGYILFTTATGPVDLVEPVSGKTTPVTLPPNCFFADWSSQGTIACFNANAPGSGLELQQANGTVANAQLDPSRFHQAGDAYFNGNATQVIVGGATGAGANGGQEQYATAFVNAQTGAVRMLSPDGLSPAIGPDSVLSDGTVIVDRPDGAAGGPAGVFAVSASGKVTQLSSGGVAVGLLTS